MELKTSSIPFHITGDPQKKNRCGQWKGLTDSQIVHPGPELMTRVSVTRHAVPAHFVWCWVAEWSYYWPALPIGSMILFIWLFWPMIAVKKFTWLPLVGRILGHVTVSRVSIGVDLDAHWFHAWAFTHYFVLGLERKQGEEQRREQVSLHADHLIWGSSHSSYTPEIHDFRYEKCGGSFLSFSSSIMPNDWNKK